MRKFFRILAMVLLSGAIVTGTVACSVPEKPEPEKTEEVADADQDADLEVWTFYDRNVPGYYYMFLWDDIAKAQGIAVDVKNYASDEMETKLELALVTGELPDVFLTPGGTFLDEFIEAGVCEPVDEYIETLNFTEEYDIPYGDSRLRMMFAIDGALAGKIIQAAMYYPEISGSVDHEKWTFSYGSDAGDPMEVDKDIYDQVTGSGSLAESEIRTLKIGAASKEYEQTFKVGSVVRFLVNIGSSGQFYTIDDKGEELILTNELNRFGEDEKLIEFEKKLNPPTGQLSYGDAAENCLFWREA